MRFTKVLQSHYTLILIMIILFLLFFSSSTSPLYGCQSENDSAIFILMGKALISGKSLYADIFDHKGPILFFIEAIGQFICNGRTGIFLIQVILLYFTYILLYKTLTLFCNKKNSILAMLMSLSTLSYFFWRR